jgi:N-methylhydantoinase B/oxoprolinase/acetone carboxylase alpha subunit
VVDALYGALGDLAASQGTMNNLTFGTEKYQYYETIAGGSGAGPGFNGAAAVQTHMTNSRITDPEVLELRYPVLVEEHSVRHGSGGKGAFCGGRRRAAADSRTRTDDRRHLSGAAHNGTVWGRRRQ